MNRKTAIILLLGLFGLGALLAPASLHRGTYAQNRVLRPDPGSQVPRERISIGQRGNDDDENTPFELNGVVWRNKRTFIESGARCATATVDETSALEVQQALDQFNQTRTGGGSDAASAQLQV